MLTLAAVDQHARAALGELVDEVVGEGVEVVDA